MMANYSLTVERRFKEILKVMPAALKNLTYYVLNMIRNEPLAKFYYQCQLVEVASRVHYFLTAKKMSPFLSDEYKRKIHRETRVTECA